MFRRRVPPQTELAVLRAELADAHVTIHNLRVQLACERSTTQARTRAAHDLHVERVETGVDDCPPGGIPRLATIDRSGK